MTPQTWLITGGAGYIGSHIADLFLENNKEVVIYDSLYQGLESRIEYLRRKHGKEIPLIVADIRDSATFEEVLATYKPHGVIHTAALKAVGESMERPDEYFEVNYSATAKMLELLLKHNIHNFIFSSTAAVYGSPDHSNSIKEDDPKNPISPYGASKLAAEDEVSKFLAHPVNRGTSLRFFNVVGTASPELMDNSVENLVPIVINKLKAGGSPVIYGTDYPTPDGTCIRDYVDVRDVAEAHLAAVNSNVTLPLAMNIGTGIGTSVSQIIRIIQDHTDTRKSKVVFSERRQGDSASLTGEVQLIKDHLKFLTQYRIDQSIKDLAESLRGSVS
jgi:UDP-glucose 4-epimerase